MLDRTIAISSKISNSRSSRNLFENLALEPIGSLRLTFIVVYVTKYNKLLTRFYIFNLIMVKICA